MHSTSLVSCRQLFLFLITYVAPGVSSMFTHAMQCKMLYNSLYKDSTKTLNKTRLFPMFHTGFPPFFYIQFTMFCSCEKWDSRHRGIAIPGPVRALLVPKDFMLSNSEFVLLLQH